MAAAGCLIGVTCEGTEHRIVIDDPAGRRITWTVSGSFDHAARVLVLSGGLRELLSRGSTPPPARGARAEAIGAWPELLELAHTGP